MIASENKDLQSVLQAGIAAVKRRDFSQGGELLLQVVEKDDQQELAWLWLSLVVDTPEDKEVALENVLTINPDNAIAQKRLARLKRGQNAAKLPPPVLPPVQAPTQAAAPPVLKPEDYLVGAPQEVDDGIDDPYQCVYCGHITAEEDQVCPSCGRALYERMPKAEVSDVLKMTLWLLSVLGVLGFVLIATPFLASISAQAQNKITFSVLLQVPGIEAFFGNYMRSVFTPTVTRNLIIVFAVRSAVYVILQFGLSRRWMPVFYTAMVLLMADVVWNGYLLFMGYLGILACLLNFVLIIVSLVLLSASEREFAIVMKRRWTKPDPSARSAAEFHWRGHTYRQDGMWALAVAQWRKAVGLAPKKVAYYKDLGIGYAQIGRFDRSLRVLEEAQRQAPHDAQIPKIIQVVREQIAPPAKPAKRT